MSQITIGGTTLNFKDSSFTGDQWEQVAGWVLNGGAEGIDANAQIATEKAAAAASSAAAARNSAKSAGESASAAASSAAKAGSYNSGAQNSAKRAATSEKNAATSERNAASSAATADSARYSAESAATDAASSQSAAKQSENLAKTYERDARSSANNARVSETRASTYASSAAESIKHAPRINASGKWELWDATTNAYVATEYTAIGKDGTKWWTYEGLVTNILGKLLIRKKDLPAAVIGDYVLATRNDAGVVYTITEKTESGDSWVVKMECILKGAAGSDGITPHIGANGNWYLGETDTGLPSRGEQGPGAEVFYIDLEGSYPDYTCPVAMSDIKTAYEAGKVLECRCAMGQFTATLPLFIPMPSADTWIFSGAGALHASGLQVRFPAQSLTIAIINGTVNASNTRLATLNDIPGYLPNQYALTVKIGSTTVTYDGSSSQTVEIADGTEVSY